MKEKSKVIVLNGPSSAGKTSLAKELQNLLPDIWLHFAMDAFWNMVPQGIKANSENFPYLKPAMAESALSLLKYNHNLII